MPPWAHRPAVPRPQLVARLCAGLESPLTLLCAPAGFGKTSLALQALDGYGAGVAWLSLEPDDSEPTRFAHYLLAAIARADPTLAPALDPMQRSSPLDLLATMATLVNLLSERDVPLVLVLEDYHALDASAVNAALSWLLAHQPPTLRLLIASREDVPLPLARLRARGQLTELRGADLRFSDVEAAALITHLTGLSLSDAQATALTARTEGWAAGLQLASLALRESADIDGLIASLRGTHRLLFDYLTDEVLLAQPPEIQQFLLQTSILDRLCGELCDALVRDEGRGMRDEARAVASEGAEPLIPHPSSLILAQLERANLFVVPLDAERRWYRYHALFADLLRARLIATAGATVAALHRRAAAWYAAAIPSHGTAMLDPAIHHALEGGDHELAADLIEHGMLTPTARPAPGGDHELAADLIERSNPHLLGRGDLALTARWLARLPPDLFARRPVLGIMHAWLLTLTGQHRAAEARLRDAEQAFAGLPAEALAQPEYAALIGGSVASIKAYLSFMRGDLEATIAHGQAALSQIPASDTAVRAASQLILGRGALERDQLALAEQQLRLATTCGLTGDNPYAALVAQGWLGELLRRQGRLAAAEQLLAPALEAQRDPGGAPFPIAGDLCVRLGLVQYERDDRAGAARLLEQGRRCGELMSNGWMVEPAYLTLAWLRHIDGDPTGAHVLLDTLEVLAPRMERMVDPGQIHALRARLRLAEGDHVAVGAWLEEERQGDLYRPAQLPIALTRARALIALGRSAEAVALLEPPLAAAEAAGRVGQQIQLQVLRALALQATGNQEQAVKAFQQALELGAACGYVRSFLDEGPGVAALLEAQSAKRKAQNDPDQLTLIERLLASLRGSTERPAQVSEAAPALRFALERFNALQEPLTARELELLRLIDAGLSNQAIAERLVLTVGTVKFYLSHLYGKLDVRGRTEALARARALGLLA
jgi:LuxR family maltose regulon positive regulatory protein